MPHLHIEFSPNLDHTADISALCRAMHEVLVASPLFPTAGIRVRAYRAEFAMVADDLAQNAFVAMTLSVGAGRSQDELREVGAALFSAGQTVLAEPLATPHFAFSLEIREINPDLSWKDTPIHARLSGPK